MADKQYRFGTIGIGGYAGVYVSAAKYLAEQGALQLIAAAVRSPDKYREKMDELEKEGVKFYPDLTSMLAAEDLDIVGVPTGIASHTPYTVEAMEAGCDVVCEKPLCATVQEAAEMIAARDRLGRKVAIGYQTMHHPASWELKRRIVEGPLGKVKRLRCKISAPRPDSYYARNSWAGRQKGTDGRWILDSPANNADAHSLQQILFYAGPTLYESAQPQRVYGEMYHGRPDIDNCDTVAIRIETAGGAEILYLVSHCVAEMWGPVIEIQCENGTATTGAVVKGGAPVVRLRDGSEEKIEMESGLPNPCYRVFTNMIGALEGKEKLMCTPDNTQQQTLVINASHDSSGGPRAIDTSFSDTGDVQYGSRRLPGRFLKGGEDAITRCFDEWKTFAEIGVPWAEAAQWIDTTGYVHFPGGKP